MKITVYCDHNGILRHNPEGWPGRSEVEISPDVLAIAKSQSIPFEDQDTILFLFRKVFHVPLIDLLNLTKPDSFYDVEIEGAIEIVFLTELDNGKLKDIGCKVTGLGSRGYTNRYARIVKNKLSGNSEQLP